MDGTRTGSRWALVVVASLVLGGLTSWAQGVLPDALSSVANSPSGWTLLTALLVLWTRFRAAPAAVAAVVSFVLLVLGYTIASRVRGLPYDPLFWSVVGVVAGPVIGVATAWLRERGLRPALGTAALTGVGIADAVYGLTVVGDTTSPVYWWLIGALGVALLVTMLLRRLRGVVPITAALVGTVAATGVLLLGFRVLNIVAAG